MIHWFKDRCYSISETKKRSGKEVALVKKSRVGFYGLVSLRLCRVSYQQEASRPVLAAFLNLRILSTLRAASSLAAASVLALALSHSTPSTMTEVQHDDEVAHGGLTEAHSGPSRVVFRSNSKILPTKAFRTSIDLEPIVQLGSKVLRNFW